MFEFFDHTADLGLRIRSDNLNTLFEEAAQAMFTAIVEDATTVQHKQEFTVTLDADDNDYLLFDWLNALLYQFETEHVLFSSFTVAITEAGLTGTARGENIDRDRHELEHEVKALTYHDLRVEQTDDGWLAEVIVDI